MARYTYIFVAAKCDGTWTEESLLAIIPEKAGTYVWAKGSSSPRKMLRHVRRQVRAHLKNAADV